MKCDEIQSNYGSDVPLQTLIISCFSFMVPLLYLIQWTVLLATSRLHIVIVFIDKTNLQCTDMVENMICPPVAVTLRPRLRVVHVTLCSCFPVFSPDLQSPCVVHHGGERHVRHLELCLPGGGVRRCGVARKPLPALPETRLGLHAG